MKRVLLIGASDSIISALGKKYTNLCQTSNDTKMYSYLYDIGERKLAVSQNQYFQNSYSLETNLPHLTRNIKLTQPKVINEITKCQDILKFIENNKIELVITPGILFNSKRNTCYDHLVDVLSNECEVEIISLYL